MLKIYEQIQKERDDNEYNRTEIVDHSAQR